MDTIGLKSNEQVTSKRCRETSQDCSHNVGKTNAVYGDPFSRPAGPKAHTPLSSNGDDLLASRVLLVVNCLMRSYPDFQAAVIHEPPNMLLVEKTNCARLFHGSTLSGYRCIIP